MSGFNFTDDDEPAPKKPASPPQPHPPAPKPVTEPVQPPSRGAAPPQRPPGVGGEAAPAGRPVQPRNAPQRPGQPAAGAPAGQPAAPPPTGPPRQVPKYGEGGVAVPQNTPGAAWEGKSNQEPVNTLPAKPPTDKTGAWFSEFSNGIKQSLEKTEPIASWALRAAFLIGAIGLAYILVAYFGGAFKTMATNPNRLLVTNNLILAAKGLSYALILGFVATLFLGYEDNRLGSIGAAMGFLVHFGAPVLFKAIGSNTNAAMAMAAQFRQAGWIILILGLIRASIDVLIWLIALPDKVKARADVGFARPAEAKQQAVAREANMFSPCWRLPFCREVIRKQCPAFLARKTCWKFGRGCYCDEEMIGRIIRGESIEVIKAPTRMARQGKPPCGRCYIFLEHQTHKFRMLSPMALPGTVLAMFLCWPYYVMGFGFFNKFLDNMWKGLSFASPQNLTPDAIKVKDPSAVTTTVNPYAVSAEQTAQWAMYMIAALLGFFLLIYISKFIEWAIYKAKL